MRTRAAQPVPLQAGSGAHLDEVERDLAQMNALLEAAIEKLTVSFMAIHRGVDSQQQTLREAAAGNPEFAVCSVRLEALREEIARHVGEAVAGLQFQDMTSQLIGRMSEHLAGLRAASPACADERPARSRHRRTVRQHHMDCGDVELF
jgi:hypothetical protein